MFNSLSCFSDTYLIIYIKKEKTRRAEKGGRRKRKRENQGEGCRRPIARSSPLLLLRLMSSPSTPSTAAHTSPRRTITEWTDGHLVRFWEMLSPPHRRTSPPIDQQPAAGHRLGLSVILPASSSSQSSSILGREKTSSRKGRKRTRAKDAADLSPVPRLSFCSV